MGAVGYLLLSPQSEQAPPTATDSAITITPAPAPVVQELDLTNLGEACLDSGLCVEVQGLHPILEITTSVGGEVVSQFTTDECALANAPSSTTGTAQLTSRGAEVSLAVPTDAPEIILEGVSMTQVVVRLPAGARMQLVYATVEAADDMALMTASNAIIGEFSRYETDVSLPACTPTIPPR